MIPPSPLHLVERRPVFPIWLRAGIELEPYMMPNSEDPGAYHYYLIKFTDGSTGHHRISLDERPEFDYAMLCGEHEKREARRDGREPRTIDSVEIISYSDYSNR